MKKYKAMGIMSLALIGGGTLVSLPLVISGCSTDKHPTFDKIKFELTLILGIKLQVIDRADFLEVI